VAAGNTPAVQVVLRGLTIHYRWVLHAALSAVTLQQARLQLLLRHRLQSCDLSLLLLLALLL
jgi:hypothetical protein